jgi:Tol biopolymer transport system component
MQKAMTVGLVAIVVASAAMSAAEEAPCMAQGEYFGLGPAGSTPVIFAPGIASTEHHDDFAPAFSPDGREVVLRILGKIGGRTVGVFFSSRMGDDGCWSVPEPLPFSGNTMDGAMSFAPDGSRLYFTSKRTAEGDADGESRSRVWYTEREGGSWADPEILDSPINRFNVNGGVTVARDGTLFVAADLPGGKGRHDIYVVRPTNGRHLDFQPIPGSVNTEGHEVAPYVDPDQRYLIYTFRGPESATVVISTRDTDGGWSKGQAIPALSGYEAKFGAISPDQSVLFFVTHQQRPDSNPKAVWPLDLFEGPALDANADVYWLSAAEALATVLRDLR